MTGSRLAPHILTPSPQTDTLIRSASWSAVKAVGNPSPLAVAADAGIPIRIFRQVGVEEMAPADAVAAFLAHDLSHASHIQICCEDAKGYDPTWQLAVMDGLRAAGYGGRFLVGNFATGNPPTITGDPPHFPQIEPIYPLLRRPDTDLAIDAYTGLLIFDPRWSAWAPYTVYRPTLIHDDLARQGIDCDIIVTESGGDNVAPVTTGGGWQTRNWSADEYLATLRAVDADDQTHPWLLARCLFTSGPTPDWQNYDIAPIAAQLAAYVASQQQPLQNGPLVPQGDTVDGKQAPMLKMVDLSRVNNVRDWAALAAAYDGAIIQTSYGGNLLTGGEERGAEYWAAAKAHGMKRIAYHYLYPQYNTPELEAANFLRNVTIDPGDGWAVDVEEPCPNPAAYSSAFMQIVEQATGAPRNWYSYWAYIQQYGITGASVGNPHLWLADYTATEPGPPPGWSSIAIWQHTSNATVPGIDGVVDEDYLYLTEQQYAALVKPQPQGETMDPITALAVNRAKAANPTIPVNTDSANFKAYREQIRVYDANGRPNYLDPGPWLAPEFATATDAYTPTDNGAVIHSTNKSGQWVTYLAEAKEHAAIKKAAGWTF